MTPADAPRECWTCRHRRQVETCGMSAYSSKWDQRCKAFRHDLLGSAEMMKCGEAYDTFCGGGDYKPTFAAKIGSWISKALA